MINRRGFFSAIGLGAPMLLSKPEAVLPKPEAVLPKPEFSVGKLTSNIVVEIDSKKIAEMVLKELPGYVKRHGLV